MLFSYYGHRCSTRATNDFSTIAVPDAIDHVGTLVRIIYIGWLCDDPSAVHQPKLSQCLSKLREVQQRLLPSAALCTDCG